MHCLVGIYLKDVQEEQCAISKSKFFGIKLIFSACKSRVLYFMSQSEKEKWIGRIKETIGFSLVTDYYGFDKTLGKGSFGLVKLGVNKITN